MADIKIATGVEKININDKVTLEFNPTDVEIVEKIFDVFNGLEDRQPFRGSALYASFRLYERPRTG